jgi:hypothetical protein
MSARKTSIGGQLGGARRSPISVTSQHMQGKPLLLNAQLQNHQDLLQVALHLLELSQRFLEVGASLMIHDLKMSTVIVADEVVPEPYLYATLVSAFAIALAAFAIALAIVIWTRSCHGLQARELRVGKGTAAPI